MDIYMLFSDIHMLKLCYLQISICSNYAIYRYPYVMLIWIQIGIWHILKILKLNYSVTINGISLILFSWTTQWLYMAYILILTGFFKSFLVGVLTVYICVVKSSHWNWHNWIGIYSSALVQMNCDSLNFQATARGGLSTKAAERALRVSERHRKRSAWKPGT
jgi:hypothetical protein